MSVPFEPLRRASRDAPWRMERCCSRMDRNTLDACAYAVADAVAAGRFSAAEEHIRDAEQRARPDARAHAELVGLWWFVSQARAKRLQTHARTTRVR